MDRSQRCDWLLERARWRYLIRSGLPAASRNEIVFFFHITNPLLTKLVQSMWLDIGLLYFFILFIYFFCVFLDLNHDSVSIHRHAKKNLADTQPP